MYLCKKINELFDIYSYKNQLYKLYIEISEACK